MTELRVDLFTKGEDQFPYATRNFEMESPPARGELWPLGGGQSRFADVPDAVVTEITPTSAGYDIRLIIDAADDDVRQVTIVENWTRHRPAHHA